MRFSLTVLASATPPFAPADSARGQAQAQTQTGLIAEIVSFRLTDDTKPAQFIEFAQETEAFVNAAPGFISRTLSQGQDGLWTDYIIWRDMPSAKAASEAIMLEAKAAPFMQAIDPDSVTMRHDEIQWQMRR